MNIKILLLLFICLTATVIAKNQSIFTVYYAEASQNNNEFSGLTWNPTPDSNSKTGYFIPKDLEGCFVELDKAFTTEMKNLLKRDPPSVSNSKEISLPNPLIASWILKSAWGLGYNTRISKYFISLGIDNPEDMGSIIFTSYKRYLREDPIDLDGQIDFFKKYWEQSELPPTFVDPQNGGVIEVTGSRYIATENKIIHIGTNSKSGETWRFEHGKGWYRPEARETD